MIGVGLVNFPVDGNCQSLNDMEVQRKDELRHKLRSRRCSTTSLPFGFKPLPLAPDPEDGQASKEFTVEHGEKSESILDL